MDIAAAGGRGPMRQPMSLRMMKYSVWRCNASGVVALRHQLLPAPPAVPLPKHRHDFGGCAMSRYELLSEYFAH